MTLRKCFSGMICFLVSLSAFAVTDTDLIGQTVPSFTLPLLSSADANFNSKLLCGRVALLNVWASWCYACKYEHATLMHIHKTTNIPIYGINYEDSPSNAAAWINKAGNPYVLIGMDADGDVAGLLGSYGLPETYVVDANGIIRYSYRGALTQQTWQAVLQPVVARYEALASKEKPTCKNSL